MHKERFKFKTSIELSLSKNIILLQETVLILWKSHNSDTQFIVMPRAAKLPFQKILIMLMRVHSIKKKLGLSDLFYNLCSPITAHIIKLHHSTSPKELSDEKKKKRSTDLL